MPLQRLQKILAQGGITSRRKAEALIVAGRVRVNTKVVKNLGTKADSEVDTIEVDGYGVIEPEKLVYIAMHKPIHVMTTVSDPEKRRTVMDLLKRSSAVGKRVYQGDLPRVFPVGRLDFDAEGLILLTNDGELTSRLLHPKYHVPKTYVVKIKGHMDDKSLERLRRGVRLRELDGSLSRPVKPTDIRVLKDSPRNSWIELVVMEGRHHLVKRLCQATGHQALRLIRTEFGNVELGDLPVGAWRFLTAREVSGLGHSESKDG